MSKEKDRLDEIREKIRTTNLNITDELLDLLYEYITVRRAIHIEEESSGRSDLANLLTLLIDPYCNNNC